MTDKIFQELLSIKAIVKLNEAEKENYLKFFNETYKDNLSAAYDNLKSHPRWSIISGYYAMHDLAKLFLAKKYNLKIVERVHLATIASLYSISKENKEFEKAIELLKQANKIFNSQIKGIKASDMAFYLKKARKEREKVQYYNPRTDLKRAEEQANFFLNEIVIPFIKLLESLI